MIALRPCSGRLALPVLVAFLGTAPAACGPRPASPDAVAVVGGEEVRYPELSEYVEAETESSVAALESEVLSHLLDQYLTERLLVRVAVDRGLVPPGVGHREALSALLDSAPDGEAERAELVARYQARSEGLALPERVQVAQILTETREEAEAALAELRAGADFAEVARRRSTDPSAPYGGSQGELAREDLPEELADVIFALRPGEVSEIVEADYGYHLFLVAERLPGRVVPFEEAAPSLAEGLREERLDAWLRGVVEEAQNRYIVKVYERNLPFDYRGAHAAEEPSADD